MEQNKSFIAYECGSGWFPLVEELLSQLKQLSPKMEIAQIKEKFGGLRFYASYEPEGAPENSSPEQFYKLIHAYEEKSFQICEECGERGWLRADLGWLRTLCPKHYDETVAVRDRRQK